METEIMQIRRLAVGILREPEGQPRCSRLFQDSGWRSLAACCQECRRPVGWLPCISFRKSPEGFSSNDRSSVVDISRPSDFYFWVLSMGDFRAILRRVVVDFPALRGLQAINGQIVLPRLSRRRKLLSKI
ncbi:hypothetical protein H0I39_02650 [Ottowia beijingensis]|uniref:Uncharacterized protein n=1 Tax=Ottowia beijingensis TaxID=1207057 RepID=A0A853IXF5_9BURK|nr:hypothetical protein [Ottowia beijingensis]NZA00949.1 hypothetical protein [Ottowia beijingensis]